ncbi:hypothetical protein [uncultured Devosia sp.]|uniref:hypothetical protein n=1 Tax=uncultured Devosia sp. TaxID=211434 RepID=UPI0026110507|nr:hypothetical protein [uncultured Devosia sp.]
MDKSDLTARRESFRVINGEARRRAGAVARVTAIVVISVLATLVFSGHRIKSDCFRAIICIEQSLR